MASSLSMVSYVIMEREPSRSSAALTSCAETSGKASEVRRGLWVLRAWRTWVVRSPAGAVVEVAIV